jgi:spermidine synthase
LELVIGLSGLLALPGFRVLERIDTATYGVWPAAATALHGLCVALLLAPATAAMGASVPVFQLLARRHRVSVSALYGINTAGAAAGVLMLAFFVMPRLGVAWTGAAAAAVNGSVFLMSRWFERRDAGHSATHESIERGRSMPEIDRRGVTLAVATFATFITGFVTFGLEVAWFRAMRSAFWSTSSTFAILLASVLVPLAIGARLVPRLRRTSIPLSALLAGAGVAILLATPVVERLDLIAIRSGSGAWVLPAWFAMSLLTIGPAILLLSTALPWFLEDFSAPQATGRLYASNAFGSVAGSIAVAWGLMPTVGFARGSWVLAAGVIALAMVLAQARGRIGFAVAGAAALAVAIGTSSSPGRDRMYGYTDFSSQYVVAFEEDADFTTSVIEAPNGTRTLLIDGFTATTEDQSVGHYMRAMGSVPAMLHGNAQRGLVICFGTGQTANALRHATSATIDVVDLSQAVLDMAPHFLVNDKVLKDDRVRPIHMDGRAWLRRTSVRYDVITLEPMPPNFSGVNSLYSQEFYEIAVARLAPGGVVAQWLPLHLLSVDHAAAVTATFQSVLRESVLWVDPISRTGILIGHREPSGRPLGSEWPGLAVGASTLDVTRGEIVRALFLDPERTAAYAATGRIVTDDNRLLEYSDLRAGLLGVRARLLLHTNWEVLSKIAGRRPYQSRQ